MPGIKRNICGKRRNIFICAAPPVAAFSLLPRSFFKSAIGPLAGLPMSNCPKRVSCTTSVALAMQIMASQCMRRARRSSRMGRKWSSKNSMPATTMSAEAMSALQRAINASLPAYSDAACKLSDKPGNSRRRVWLARWIELAKCVSMVTTTTLIGVVWRAACALPSEVSFSVIKSFRRDHREATLRGVTLGISPGFATDKKRYFSQFFFCV